MTLIQSSHTSLLSQLQKKSSGFVGWAEHISSQSGITVGTSPSLFLMSSRNRMLCSFVVTVRLCGHNHVFVSVTPNEYILSNDDTEHKLIVNKFSPQTAVRFGKKGNKAEEFYYIATR